MAVLFLLLTALFWIAVIGGGFYVAVRALRAFEQRGALPPPRTDAQRLDARVARLEEALEQMSAEMERLAEGQQFTHRLLAERHEHRPGETREPGTGNREP